MAMTAFANENVKIQKSVLAVCSASEQHKAYKYKHHPIC